MQISALRARFVLVALIGFMWLTGCEQARSRAARPPGAGVDLTVAVVGEPDLLEAVRVQGRDWESRTGGKLTFNEQPVSPSEAAAFDVVIFEGTQLGALVDAGAIVPVRESAVRPVDTALDAAGDAEEEEESDALLDEEARRAKRDPIDFNDVAQPFREQVTKYGDDRMALPLGSTALVLVYRRDAFQSKALVDAAKAAKIALKAPETWDEFDALARFFQGRDWNGDGAPDHGLALAIDDNAEGLLESFYLSRAATLGQPPDQFALLFDSETMDSRVATPPFVDSLKGLIALKEAGPPDIEKLDAAGARAAFRAGKVALLIDRAERASQWTDPKTPVPVGLAPLPASPIVFDPTRKTWINTPLPNRVSYLPAGGGWLVAIGSHAKANAYDGAISFLQLLASPETAQAVVSDPAFPMTPVRTSHLALGLPDPRGALGVDTREWGKTVAATFEAPRVAVGLRIPDAEGYLQDLRGAVRAAMRGEQSPEAALQDAAKAWNRRTTELGRARQLWHYRRSLNRLSTTSTPPPKD